MKIARGLLNFLFWLACLACLSCKGNATPQATSASASAVTNPPPAPSVVRATVLKLQREALTLSNQHDFAGAKAKILEAQALAPTDPDLKGGLASVEEMQSKLVAGRWMKDVKRDAMTDKDNVFVTLAAANDVDAVGENKRPTLTARCVKGEASLLVSVDSVLDVRNYPKTHVQFRFDSESPQSVGVVGATGLHAFFMDTPAKCFDQLIAHSSGKLIMEVPLFGHTPQPVTFELLGADVAVGAVKSACPK
jgi:hypothetical protein